MNNLQSEVRALYIGFHPHTPIWAGGPGLRVEGASYLGFLFRFTLNPADLLFQAMYACRCLNLRFLEITLALLYPLLSSLHTEVYRRYQTYLRFLVKNKVAIVHVDQRASLEDFFKKGKSSMILVNSWSLLPDWLIAMPSLGTINIHPSKLPAYRGALPTLWSLKNSESNTAVSIVRLNQGVDAGGLIAQLPIDIARDETALSLEHKIDAILKKSLYRTLEEYLEGSRVPVAQIGEPSTTGKYEAYRHIHWSSERSKDILNKITLYPYLEPYVFCFTKLNGKRVILKNARFDSKNLYNVPGSFTIRGASVYVQATDGVLSCRLFKDIPLIDSAYLLCATKRQFSD